MFGNFRLTNFVLGFCFGKRITGHTSLITDSIAWSFVVTLGNTIYSHSVQQKLLQFLVRWLCV